MNRKTLNRNRNRTTLALFTAAFAALCLLATQAFASKEVADYYGANDGNFQTQIGGELSSARDVAVNSSGVGPADPGDIYVADSGNNRIQRFDSAGNFVSAWGANVLTPSVNEVQTLTVNATAGTYTLSFDGSTTGDIAYNASVSAVQSALRALPSVAGSNLSVPSGTTPYTITFNGSLSATNVPQLSADTTNLTGSLTPATTTQGSGAYEVCTVAANCRAGASTGGANVADAAKNGSFNSPDSLAVDEDTGNVYVSDRGNFRVSEYTGDGVFIRSFGFGVDADTPGDGYEVCPAADRCKFGLAGSGAGQLGSTGNLNGIGGTGIAVSPPGAGFDKLYLADTANRRVNTYDLDGQNPSSFGSSSNFSSNQPRKIAVDSRGIVYATNDNNGGQIERYDSLDASGGGAGFLAPIGATIAGTNETQRITFAGLSSASTFRLTCPNGDSTSPITYGDLSAVRIDAVTSALEAKCGPSFTVVNAVPGQAADILDVTFEGNFAATNVPLMVCTRVSGTGGCSVTERQAGIPTVPGALRAGATAGVAVSPDSDGAGPDKDVLYVLRQATVANHAVQQFGPLNEPGLSAAPTAADDIHGAGAGFSTVISLGLDDAIERLFVGANLTGVTQNAVSGQLVFALDDNVAPGATLDAPTGVSAHSATFSGSVDPNGFYATYRFEYVDDAEFQANGFANAKRWPNADVALGKGEDPVAVGNETPHTLTPSTTYHVRLLAGQAFSPTETVAGPLTFTTPAAAPSVEANATEIGTDHATLRGAVDPQNQAVSDYHFNWGTDTGYGNTTTPGNLAQGASPVAVSANLANLAPGQTYHYQLVATNPTGTTTGPDRTFTTPAQAPGLGPARGYEVVTQYPTEGIPYYPNFLTSATEDGDYVTFGAPNPLPGSETPVPGDNTISGNAWAYGSTRGPDGWHVQQLGFSFGLQYGDNAPNAQRGVFVTQEGLDPDDQNGAYDVYMRQPDGSYVWLSRDPRIPAGAPQTAGGYAVTPNGFVPAAAMSVDGRTVVFESQRHLLDADTTPGPDGTVAPSRLYKWSDGQLSFIGARPDGSAPGGGSRLGSAAPGGGDLVHTVSRDGSRVVWGAKRSAADTGGPPYLGDGNTIYVQSDGEPTVRR